MVESPEVPSILVVGVAQLAEHRVVAPVVEGSSPFTHPILFAPVAQMDRAPDLESVGRRFESCRAYQYNQLIMALCHSPHFEFFSQLTGERTTLYIKGRKEIDYAGSQL